MIDPRNALTELSDDPLSYELHIVPNQDGQGNHGAYHTGD